VVRRFVTHRVLEDEDADIESSLAQLRVELGRNYCALVERFDAIFDERGSMTLVTPPSPPPAPPVWFCCPSCGAEARFTSDELEPSGTSGPGVIAWRQSLPVWRAAAPHHAAGADAECGASGSVMECLIHRHPAGVEVRCGYGEDEITSLLLRLAAIGSRCPATVRFTNAAVRFGHTQVVPVRVPCVVTAIAFVANPDHVARQHTVLSHASDGSAARAIKSSHAYDTIEKERRPSLARATSSGKTSFAGVTAHPVPADGATRHSTLRPRRGPTGPEVLVCPRFLSAVRCWNGRSTGGRFIPNMIHSRLNGGELRVGLAPS
jgi:hypothetical protein